MILNTELKVPATGFVSFCIVGICTTASSAPTSAGILEQSMGARNRVGIGLSYLLVRQNRLPEPIPGLLKRFINTGSGYIGWANFKIKNTTVSELFLWQKGIRISGNWIKRSFKFQVIFLEQSYKFKK
jgi:hypothetical protein